MENRNKIIIDPRIKPDDKYEVVEPAELKAVRDLRTIFIPLYYENGFWVSAPIEYSSADAKKTLDKFVGASERYILKVNLPNKEK